MRTGLEPTPVLTAATKPGLDWRAGRALTEMGAAIVNALKTSNFAGEQTSPENHIVGCAGGADVTGNDCM